MIYIDGLSHAVGAQLASTEPLSTAHLISTLNACRAIARAMS